MAEREKRTEITQDKALVGLESLKKSDAMQLKEGGQGMRNHAAAIKALELQGKHRACSRRRMSLQGKTAGRYST
jgi:hypothetical protein